MTTLGSLRSYLTEKRDHHRLQCAESLDGFIKTDADRPVATLYAAEVMEHSARASTYADVLREMEGIETAPETEYLSEYARAINYHPPSVNQSTVLPADPREACFDCGYGAEAQIHAHWWPNSKHMHPFRPVVTA